MNKSRGRPRGRPDTRGRLVEAARPLFREHGFRGTTVRAVAAAAGVDSALISYHFGSKQGLFAASLRLPCSDPSRLARALAGDRDGLAGRLLAALVAQWDDAPGAELRLAAQDEGTVAALRDWLDGELRSRIAEFLGGPHATRRATAAVGVLSGVVHTRWLSPLGTVADLAADDVVELFRPALHAALWRAPRDHDARRTPVRASVAPRG